MSTACASRGYGTSGNLVAGDQIGTDINGANALPNYDGVVIQIGATGNTVGGTTASARDVISGNSWDGVELVDGGVSGNVVEGDYIGVAAGGSSALGNAASGVAVLGGATGNTIGGTAAGTADVLSGNASGVNLGDIGTSANVVEGDFIGTDPTGSFALPNQNGVLVQNGASGNTIGGTSTAARDVISGNYGDGVHIVNGATANVVEGDYIGVTPGLPSRGGHAATVPAPWATGPAAWPSSPARPTTPSAARRMAPATSSRPAAQNGVYHLRLRDDRQRRRGRLHRHRPGRPARLRQLRRGAGPERGDRQHDRRDRRRPRRHLGQQLGGRPHRR